MNGTPRKLDARKPYKSQLRDDQVELTRERVLDATIRTLARGVTELSIPAVAKESGVSVPTIYLRLPTIGQASRGLKPRTS